MVIDIHTHLFAPGWVPAAFFHGVARFITHAFSGQGLTGTNEEVGDALLEAGGDPDGTVLLAEMDEAGIDTSVLLPVDFGLALGEPELSIEEVNRRYARLAGMHPDRFIAFAGVDPRRKGACDLFRRCIEQWHMRGLKLHPCTGFYPNQQEVYALLEIAQQNRLPVLIHSGAMMVPLYSKYSQAIYFDDIAADFPDLAIVAAHAGGSIGYAQMLSIMSSKLNILVDISGWQICAQKNYDRFCRSLRDIMDFSGPERVFFGSDSPSMRSLMANAEWVQLIRDLPGNAPEGIIFTDEEIAGVLGGNAQKLLALSPE